jgi:hypothetical protein
MSIGRVTTGHGISIAVDDPDQLLSPDTCRWEFGDTFADAAVPTDAGMQ